MHIIFEQYDIYPKASFRNRLMIANANGKVTLSIPIAGGRTQRKCYKDIRIDNRINWKNNHWKNLESAYNRSPWFSFYHDELKSLYERSFGFLIDWNLACFDWLIASIGLEQIRISCTDEFRDSYDPAIFTDLRQSLLPSNYDQFSIPKYHQVFEEKLGFLSNLSILDLIFCEGPGARELLKTVN